MKLMQRSAAQSDRACSAHALNRTNDASAASRGSDRDLGQQMSAKAARAHTGGRGGGGGGGGVSDLHGGGIGGMGNQLLVHLLLRLLVQPSLRGQLRVLRARPRALQPSK